MKVTTLQKVYRCLPAVLDLSCFDNAREPLAASASRGQGPESVHQAPGGVDRRPVYPAAVFTPWPLATSANIMSVVFTVAAPE